MKHQVSRRSLLKTASLGAFASGVPLLSHSTLQANQADSSQTSNRKIPVRYCFNTSCIREAKLSLPEIINLVSKAGYDGIEPWIREIQDYVNKGGKLEDLKKLLEDRNLKVESAIGFARWSVDDERERAAGFEEARRDMELVRSLGGTRIAAPPIGIHLPTSPLANLDNVALRYRQLLELGKTEGVIPQLEIWGASKNLSKLAELIYVAMAANHPLASLLPDIYHLYRGGSDFDGLRLLSGQSIQVFHINDYPANPPREQQTDADRVYPGDGIAPLKQVIQTLKQIGFRGALSLELFNQAYWKQAPETVVNTGLEKMKSVVEEAWNS